MTNLQKTKWHQRQNNVCCCLYESLQRVAGKLCNSQGHLGLLAMKDSTYTRHVVIRHTGEFQLFLWGKSIWISETISAENSETNSKSQTSRVTKHSYNKLTAPQGIVTQVLWKGWEKRKKVNLNFNRLSFKTFISIWGLPLSCFSLQGTTNTDQALSQCTHTFRKPKNLGALCSHKTSQ